MPTPITPPFQDRLMASAYSADDSQCPPTHLAAYAARYKGCRRAAREREVTGLVSILYRAVKRWRSIAEPCLLAAPPYSMR